MEFQDAWKMATFLPNSSISVRLDIATGMTDMA